MKLTIEIPDAQSARVINALCSDYEEMIYKDGKDIPNPVTKNVYARNKIISILKQITLAYELKEAQKSIIVEEVDII